jgi:hypothetical protein
VHGSLPGLLATAAARTPTVRLTVRRWQDAARLNRLLVERGLMQPLPPIPPEEGSWGELPAELRSTTRLWVRRPASLRWETTAAGPFSWTSTCVSVDGVYWERHGADDRVATNEDEPGSATWTDEQLLVEPAPLVAALELREEGEASVGGRAALRVRGRRRPLVFDGHTVLGPVTDEVELLVDRDTGLVLYLGRRAEGETLESLEVVDLGLGETLDDALFEPLR